MLARTNNVIASPSGRSNLILTALAAAAIAAVFGFVDPIPQDPAYHRFADTRNILGISNFWNVLSNLPFLIVGYWGMWQVSRRTIQPASLRPAYLVFFFGIFMTALGSGYYHLAPDNDSLILDRLPMTIGFAGLFAIVIGELVSSGAANRVLITLLIAGVASVAYWAWTEGRGAGDLRPYAIVQFLPLLLIAAVLFVYRNNRLVPAFGLMVLCYVLAKLAEFFDGTLFSLGQILSGHSLKHLLAAIVPVILLVTLHKHRHPQAGK